MRSCAVIVLAAGRSTRMGMDNKLLADLGGAPVIARTLANALASRARPVIVVTGHQGEEIRAAAGAPMAIFAANPAFATGMTSSLRVGLRAVPTTCEGAVILLGDMPLIEAAVIDRLIDAAGERPESAAIVPTVDGEWAHPVLLRRALFDSVAALSGDVGARALLSARSDVATIPFDDRRLLMDADDAGALARIRLRHARDASKDAAGGG